MDSSSTTPAIQQIDAEAANGNVDAFVHIWALENPDLNQAVRKQGYRYLTRCSGFRCFVATASDGTAAGFALGADRGTGADSEAAPADFLGTHDLIETYMKRVPVAPRWLEAFEVAELQVLKPFREQKTGRNLLHALLSDLPDGRDVVLTVDEDENAASARHLYEIFGFKEITRVSITRTEGPPARAIVMRTIVHLPIPSVS